MTAVQKMLLSGISSFVALLGAAISLLTSVAGLFSGPYCLYREDHGATQNWGYPKLKIVNNSSVSMAPAMSSWSGACIEPPHIETWHSSFFILLSLSNILQIFLCLSQLVNAMFGVLCGHCDQKK
ncbi:transmembrane 4 L6 family member 19-like [Rhinoderma darwinii]|uniref:transmembrane 4 L6 family member 19-like n=1 Tax=Rhinoderma darwinii TaxID=43563 RepID=UPI003F673AC4